MLVMTGSMEGVIEDVVAIVKAGQVAGRGCSLLIGAGCSITANIPSAAGFVEIIKTEFPSQFDRAEPKTYPSCMAALPPSTQRDLIARYVDKAKINWAHIAIAQLMAHGWVDRILTTNFDPLVVRACSLVGLHPAVYDFAASQLLKPEQVPNQAVFHLHGQRTGFVLMNTEKDCREHSERLGPLFRDAGLGRTWIVVGYSGDNDPVFDHLAGVDLFGQTQILNVWEEVGIHYLVDTSKLMFDSTSDPPQSITSRGVITIQPDKKEVRERGEIVRITDHQLGW